MDSHFWHTAADIGLTVGGIVAVLGVLYRVVLLPNLREQLFKPVADIADMTTRNGHRDGFEPSLRDDVKQTKNDVAELRDLVIDHLKVADGDRVSLARVVADVEKLKGKR